MADVLNSLAQSVTAFAPTAFLLAGAAVLTIIAVAIGWSLYRGGATNQTARFLFEPSSDGKGDGKPSVSRLQMLIWNFVVAFAFLYVLAAVKLDTSQTFKNAIDALFCPEILFLLGISNGTYLIGKRMGAGPGSAAVQHVATGADGTSIVQSVPVGTEGGLAHTIPEGGGVKNEAPMG